MFIHERMQSQGVSPSFDEMKDALELKSKSGIHRLITGLEERGFLRRLPHRARALEILRLPKNIGPVERARLEFAPRLVDVNEPKPPAPTADILSAAVVGQMMNLPLYGRIAAGTPIEALRDETNTIEVPQDFVGTGEHYALEVEGDSMVEAGIFDGDFALIKRTDNARDGEIVVALVDNEEATLKYLRRDAGRVRLDPANSAYEAQMYEPHRVQVQGKLAGLLRRYH